MKRKYTLLIIILLSYNYAFTQSNVKVFTADALESGNSKDILTNFFQLAFNNLTGKSKEFNFSTSPYAIMLKRNPDLGIDTKYSQYRPLRKLNLSFGLKLDSSFGFSGFSSAIKYALIDKTDITTSKTYRTDALRDSLRVETFKLKNYLATYAREKFPTSADEARDKFDSNANSLFKDDKAFAEFDDDFKKIVLKIVKENKLNRIKDILASKPTSSFNDIDIAKFEQKKELMRKNLLWTIGVSDTTYKDKFQLANVSIVSELSKGIFNPTPGKNTIELNAKAAYNFLNDTLRNERNLKRQIFTLESGFNWVIREHSSDKPFLEIKFAGAYYHNFATVYKDEKRNQLTLNTTIRARLIDDIWIPLEVKYDPESGKIFGFLNIKANFGGIAKLLQ